MNFAPATHIRDIMWFDGPLLMQYEMNDKTYLCKWADIVEHELTRNRTAVWLIIEVAPEVLGLYMAKAITMRDVEERSPAVFIQEGFIEDSDASCTEYENIPDDWKAPSTSYYDESLQYGY